jgi:formyltetrahydrofolate-dependent phosphoribosylglycinamide formyltransferase
MCSGNGTNFQNIVTNYDLKEHEVVLMIHNTKECGAAKKAAKYGIPHVRIAHKDEDQMIEMFKAWNVDLIILAGYMRVLKDPDSFSAPIINVHPSLLPKYKGLHAVEQALESGDRITGCTVHMVTKELDSGKILMQGIVPIHRDDNVKSLTRRIQLEEYRILPMTISQLTSL